MKQQMHVVGEDTVKLVTALSDYVEHLEERIAELEDEESMFEAIITLQDDYIEVLEDENLEQMASYILAKWGQENGEYE